MSHFRKSTKGEAGTEGSIVAYLVPLFHSPSLDCSNSHRGSCYYYCRSSAPERTDPVRLDGVAVTTSSFNYP